MTRRRFRGVYPILYAFYDKSGRVDPGMMRAQVEHCLAAGAHGVANLGIVTEVGRLSSDERRNLMALVGETIGGRAPYAVTAGEPDAASQIAFCHEAARHGADWVILRPPPGKGHKEADLQRYFGEIADAVDLPVAVQNNPVNLDVALSPEALIALVRRHSNITLLKPEGWSVEIEQVLGELGDAVDAFGGHGGIEFLSHLRAGGAGLIPAPDCLALQVAMFEALTSGEPERIAVAERAHEALLPLVVFVKNGGVPGILCYGKRAMAKRLGFREVFDRQPAVTPTAFGLSEMERLLADVTEAERTLIPHMSARVQMAAVENEAGGHL